jgi:spermidine dehydrogenase
MAKSKVTQRDSDSSESMTRRDFINGVLAGSGSALLSMSAPSLGQAMQGTSGIPNPTLNASWTGPGGVGDYAQANGNTHVTVNAAHALRDHRYDTAGLPQAAADFDLVVVGGGIAGLCSAYEFIKARGSRARVLVLENNGIFGGEAKRNEFEVDGYRLLAPQGSNMCLWPAKIAEKLGLFWHNAWRELGLPMGDEPGGPTWAEYPKMNLPKNHYSAMMVVRDRWPQAQFFRDPRDGDRWHSTMSPWRQAYRDLPWPQQAKEQLARVDSFVLKPPAGIADTDRWLDSMTYKDYLAQMVGVTQPEVFRYLDPEIACYGTGMGCDSVSALAAKTFLAPAMSTAEELARIEKRRRTPELNFEPVSFPGGNTAIARYFIKRLIPDAIAGEPTLEDILYGGVRWSALDRSDQSIRIRVNATVIDVRHQGSPDSSSHVLVGYVDNLTGAKHRVRAKAAILAGGQWVNKYVVVHDAPESLLAAMGEFNHAPMLIVNVAVRQWRFLDKLGAPALRWFDSLGWFTNLRAPMSINGRHMPVDPTKPAVLTFYIPYTGFTATDIAGLPVHAQCVAARWGLYNLSFRDIELRIRQQLAETLAPYGFDDARDVAGVITNRWGHAYVTLVPGFYYGLGGKPAPRTVVQAGYGRVRFGHSELSGEQLWPHACGEGERAARQVLDFA